MPVGPSSRRWAVMAAVLVLAWGAACGIDAGSQTGADQGACAEGRTLKFAYYAFFDPVSASADSDPGSPGFTEHVGYEADLLTALEAMEGAGLRFDRTPITEWADIWLLPVGPDFDIAGGGITILESRTVGADGTQVVEFTSGHIAFRQSLLVRAEDAVRYPTHGHLTGDHRVGVLAGTTGEARLLQLTGLTDSQGRLDAGVRVVTDTGTVTADGGAGYVITAADASPGLERRRRLQPSSAGMPVVIYLGENTGEADLLDALADGSVDAVARGEIGNVQAARTYHDGGVLAVTALDSEVELGGWALPVAERALIACLDEKLGYLTDNRAIGFAEWIADPEVFLRRARDWSP